MDLEKYKSAWQNRPMEGPPLSTQESLSRHLKFLRTSSIRDLQRSEEVARLTFSILFALIAVGVSLIVIHAGAARIAAWLFALALLADGAISLLLLIRRFRAPARETLVDFISSEYRQIESRLRFERYSQRFMLLLAAITLILMLLYPSPLNVRENAFDTLARMAVVTVFLAVAWRRTKTHSAEISSELKRYLKDLDG